MFSRKRITTGLTLALAAGVIAGGPALAGALGANPSSAANLSASWEAEQQLNAAKAADSHADVLARAAADEKARKRKAAAAKARAKAQAQAKAAAKRKRAAAAAARAATRLRGGTPAQNRALGMQMCADKGWSASQCAALDRLFLRESGWNHRASNGSSGAYGIPQALPGSKMGSVASDWRTNPRTQIAWGLNYIKGRYGNPASAWAHSQRTGWY